MKQRQPHRVPLSQQALAILREAEALSGGNRFVFPKLGSPLKPMCGNAINGALRRLGYGPDNMTAHGFRSTASSLLNESGKWSYEAIERALSHADGNQVRAAYHRGAHWPERVEMAQWWSDYLEVAEITRRVERLEQLMVGLASIWNSRRIQCTASFSIMAIALYAGLGLQW